MSINILDDTRAFLVNSLRGKKNSFETKHPWRKDWEFAVLHSLRVESYALKILARERHHLSESEVNVLRLAAILHDIARLEKTDNHAKMEAEIVEKWIQLHFSFITFDNDFWIMKYLFVTRNLRS